jgi:S-methylmethionine-dependent homocysteine/selenocysteine methylase
MERQYRIIANAMAAKVDVFICETMSCSLEAVQAAKAASETGKPVWVSFCLRDDAEGRLLGGESLQEAMQALNGIKLSAVFFNCCLPEAIEMAIPIVRRYTDAAIGAMPNCFAPLPSDWTLESKGFRTLRVDMSTMDFAGYARGWADQGVTYLGGCCGIGPEHIQAIHQDLKEGNFTCDGDGPTHPRKS